MSELSDTPKDLSDATNSAGLKQPTTGWLAVVDPKISTLPAILDPAKLSRQIGLLPASQWRWGAPQEVRMELLRWHPGRSLAFEIVLSTGSGSFPLIGKVYAKDRQDVYQAMEEIWRAGFGQEADLSIPQPIAYLPALRLLLQEKVEGLAMEKIFRYGDERLRAMAAERCGRWLARFHSLVLASDRVSRIEKILDRCERASRLICKEDESLAAKSGGLFETLRAATPNAATIPLAPCHGDFAFHNILFVGRRTVTFDWDLHGLADPARDVARFVVILKRQALHRLGSLDALDGAAGVFLEAYLTQGGWPVAPRLPFYKAVLCLRGAESDVKNKDSEWRARAEAMLDEGLRILG